MRKIIRYRAVKLVATEMVLTIRFAVSNARKVKYAAVVTPATSGTIMKICFFENFPIFTSAAPFHDGWRNQLISEVTEQGSCMHT